MNGNKRVLVVEDLEDSRIPLLKLLKLEGYDVSEAADGGQAVARAVETEPDLILMDLSLPVLDGLEAIKEIRNQPLFAHVPIIAISGHDLPDIQAEAEAAGCAAYITKPVDFEALVILISKLLRGRAVDSSR